jgi:hypothetical protein
MSEEKFGDLEDVDITNEVFWQKLSETFQETLSMLKEGSIYQRLGQIHKVFSGRGRWYSWYYGPS